LYEITLSTKRNIAKRQFYFAPMPILIIFLSVLREEGPMIEKEIVLSTGFDSS